MKIQLLIVFIATAFFGVTLSRLVNVTRLYVLPATPPLSFIAPFGSTCIIFYTYGPCWQRLAHGRMEHLLCNERCPFEK